MILIAAVALLDLRHAIPCGMIYKTWNMSAMLLRGKLIYVAAEE
jgi:hypothetical protein